MEILGQHQNLSRMHFWAKHIDLPGLLHAKANHIQVEHILDAMLVLMGRLLETECSCPGRKRTVAESGW